MEGGEEKETAAAKLLYYVWKNKSNDNLILPVTLSVISLRKLFIRGHHEPMTRPTTNNRKNKGFQTSQ